MKVFHAGRLLCLVTLLMPSAHAMTDPTRPPASVALEAHEPMRAAPVLQSVIIGRHTRAAIIDGERVEVGGNYRDARVVRITEDEVVLRQGALTQVLRMYPDVERKAVKAREVGPPRPASRSGLP